MFIAWPRSLRVLTAPGEVFLEAARTQSGLGTLLGWLGLECALLYPGSIVAALFRMRAAPAAVLQTLWGMAVRYAVGPVFFILAGAVLLHLLTRRRGVQHDMWAVASALAYTWVPHTLLVALKAALAGADVHPAVLVAPAPFAPYLAYGQLVLLYGPTAYLASVAMRTLTSTAVAARPPPWQQTPVAVAALVLWLSGCLGAGWDLERHWGQVKPVGPGDRFPALVLHGLNHSDMDLAVLPGKVILVDFWASWCAPCVASMPHLQHLQNSFGPRGFAVLAINIEPDNVTEVRRFVADTGLTLPVFLDDGSAQQRLHVSVYPTSFLMDATGIVREIYYGPAPQAALEAKIKALLAGS